MKLKHKHKNYVVLLICSIFFAWKTSMLETKFFLNIKLKHFAERTFRFMCFAELSDTLTFSKDQESL